MKQFLITLAAVFAALVLFFVGVPVLLLMSAASALGPGPVADRGVLVLDLRGALADQPAAGAIPFLPARSTSVVEIVQTLKAAEADPRVRALFVRPPEGGTSPAVAEEIAGAIASFRAAGKPALSFSQGVLDTGTPLGSYLVGVSTGDLWMQPGAPLQASGASLEEPFLKRAFDRYGLQADFLQREAFKTAVNPLLHDDFTPEHRLSEISWMGSALDAQIRLAAKVRGVAPDRLRPLLLQGPYLAEEARAKGLIDRVGEERDAEAAVLGLAGSGARFVPFARYQAAVGVERRRASASARVALVGVEGDISTGAAQGLAVSGARSDEVSQRLLQAGSDPSVRAVVLRVSSPGGSDTASEQILSAVRAVRRLGKPVVVSMGAYAASGGYWISSAADEIVAEPSTLTGSIGVFGGKFVVGPALARFGVDLRTLSVGGPSAGAFAAAAPFTPAQRASVSRWLDAIYAEFLQRVASGRRLPLARVREIAKGRVWTGEQAKALGLVDRLGGLRLAADEARRLARLPADAPLLAYVRPVGPLEALGLGLRGTEAAARLVSTALALASDPRAEAALSALGRAGLGPGSSTVLEPALSPR